MPICDSPSLVATHQKTQQGLKRISRHGGKPNEPCRNASENPTGIETYETMTETNTETKVATHQKTQQGLKPLSCGDVSFHATVATHQKTQQGLKLSITSINATHTCRNASENPTGIETTEKTSFPVSLSPVATHQKT